MLQDTIEAVLIIPFSSAARNATSTLLLFKLLGLQQAYLAALLVLVITLFPLTYPWVVTTPWVLAHILMGHWGRAICLFAGAARPPPGRGSVVLAGPPALHQCTLQRTLQCTAGRAVGRAIRRATIGRGVRPPRVWQACCSPASSRRRRSSGWSVISASTST